VSLALVKSPYAHAPVLLKEVAVLRLPVILAATWPCEDRSDACKKEYRYKQLTRADKIKLINSDKN